MRGTIVLVSSLSLGFALTGCGRGLRASDITKMAVVQSICDVRCRSWAVTLYPNGEAETSGDAPHDDIRVHFRSGAYADYANILATQTAFFTGRSDYRRIRDPQDSTFITAWTGRVERQVVVPSLQEQTITDPGLHSLQVFAWLVASEVFSTRHKARARTTKRMKNLSALSMVEYRANGCYGTCPAYTVRFFPDGHASIDSFDIGKTHAIATVPFGSILQILRASDFTELESQYKFFWVDVFGAHLHLLYRDGFSFDSDAPDRTQWPPQFQALSDRIDQVVLDNKWMPPLPRRTYHR